MLMPLQMLMLLHSTGALTLERKATVARTIRLQLSAGSVVRLRAVRLSGSDTLYTVPGGSGLGISGPLPDV